MRKQTVSYISTIILIAFLLGTVIGQAANPTTTTFLEPGSLTETADFILWEDNNNVFSKDGETGYITYLGTDIGAAINTLKDLLGNTGGTIYIKGGAYSQTATITLDETHENITVCGESYKTSTVFTSTADIFAFNITGVSTSDLADHIQIKNLKLVAGVVSTKAAIFLQYVGGSRFENIAIDYYGFGISGDTGVTPNTVSQCDFETITLFECVYSGIVLQDSYDNRLTDIRALDTQGAHGYSYAGILLIHSYGGDVLEGCLALNGDGHGISITENSQWVMLSNCISDYNGGHNIFISESQGTQLINCWGSTSQSANTYGLNIDGSNDTIVTNGQFRTNYSHGVYVKDSDNTQFLGILSTTNGQNETGYGMSLVNSTETVITNAILDNRFAAGFNATSQTRGIDEDSDSDYNVIIGCNTRGLTTGIIIQGANTKVNLCWNASSWIS